MIFLRLIRNHELHFVDLLGTHPKGGWQAAAPPQIEILKRAEKFCWHWYQRLCVIYPPAAISHLNRLVTSTLEFWKVKWTIYYVLDELKKNRKIRRDFKLGWSWNIYISAALKSIMLHLYLWFDYYYNF
jgi:hypothetical protein